MVFKFYHAFLVQNDACKIVFVHIWLFVQKILSTRVSSLHTSHLPHTVSINTFITNTSIQQKSTTALNKEVVITKIIKKNIKTLIFWLQILHHAWDSIVLLLTEVYLLQVTKQKFVCFNSKCHARVVLPIKINSNSHNCGK